MIYSTSSSYFEYFLKTESKFRNKEQLTKKIVSREYMTLNHTTYN